MSGQRPTVVHTVEELRAAVAEVRRGGRSIGLVPTMGALHRGHASLVDAAVRDRHFTVVSIFVNPAQFGPQEDYSRYPRTLDADLALLSQCRADLVFAPSVETMYGAGHSTYVELAGAAEPLEGERRPGHFRGVATVVLKLFLQCLPDVAYFGQKDFQQSLVIRQFVRELDVPVQIQVCPIVRDLDGLALSSRNVYLSAEQRSAALVLSRSLAHARDLVAQGQTDIARLLTVLKPLYAAAPLVQLEYLTVRDRVALAPLQQIDRPAVLLVAARVGTTRLIDNELLDPPG